MGYSHINRAALTARHLEGALLYANRYDLMKSMRIERGCVIAEVGVAIGDFSVFLIEELKPSKFVAVDLFNMEERPIHWGVPQEVLLKGLKHFEFYRRRMAPYGDLVSLERGFSHDCLGRFQDKSFDMIYVDAAHDYENALRDGELALKKIKDNGIIVFNDYVMYDPFIDSEYGVVQAVNELILREAWSVIGFAFETNMFCDIAIRRSPLR